MENVLEGRSGFGTLKIGATLTIGNYLDLIVAEHLQRYGDSRVELRVNNTATIIEQVANFELDLGLIESDCQHRDLVATPWVDDELVVFGAPSHRLAGQDSVWRSTSCAEDWIMREVGSGTRQTLDQALSRNGFRARERRSSNTPRRSSAPSNPAASASAASRGSRCAKRSAAKA